MSVLVDLLSKKFRGEPQEGKEIPPTLARSQDLSASKQNSNKRYLLIILLAVAFAMAALVVPSKLKRLTARKPVKYPMPPPAATMAPQPQTAAVPPPAQPAQPLPAQPQPAPAPDQPKAVEQQTGQKTSFSSKPVKRMQKRSVAKRRTPNKDVSLALPNIVFAKKQLREEPRKDAPVKPKIDTEERSALLYSARSAEQSGDWGSALTSYRKALELDPNNYKIMSNSAAALNNLGMFEEGAKVAKRALERKPDYVPAMINFAIACSSQGNNDEALSYFSAAYAADPSNRNVAVNLGILQERMGRLDEAGSTYRRLGAAGDPMALMGLGRIAELTGNKAEAVSSYRQVISKRDITPSLRKEATQRLSNLE